MIKVDLSAREDETEGFNLILSKIHDTWDDADHWGSGNEWLVSLGDVYYAETGNILPGYIPFPYASLLEELNVSDYRVQEIYSAFNDEILTTEDMENLYAFLDQLDDQFRGMGLNY